MPKKLYANETDKAEVPKPTMSELATKNEKSKLFLILF